MLVLMLVLVLVLATCAVCLRALVSARRDTDTGTHRMDGPVRRFLRAVSVRPRCVALSLSHTHTHHAPRPSCMPRSFADCAACLCVCGGGGGTPGTQLARDCWLLLLGSLLEMLGDIMQSPDVAVKVLLWVSNSRQLSPALEHGTRAVVLRAALEHEVAKAKEAASDAARTTRYDDATAIADAVLCLYEDVVVPVGGEGGAVDAMEELRMLVDLATHLHDCTPSSKVGHAHASHAGGSEEGGEGAGASFQGTDLLARLDEAARLCIFRIVKRGDEVEGREVRELLAAAARVFADEHWLEFRSHGLFKGVALAAGSAAAPLLVVPEAAAPAKPRTTAEVYLAALARVRDSGRSDGDGVGVDGPAVGRAAAS